ncbi:MAG: threonine/serine exporter family protein [Ruminococcaceae bacterium]|nr:threonine/serine exporter family protein [Oscillospiraceae bacterium]
MVKLFGYAMDIGEQMLISGAEVHRVEESINRMCHALGAVRVDVFIITSSMVVTIHTEDGNTYTQTRRVTTASFNFEKLHYLNNLSREICENKLTEQEIEKKLSDAKRSKKFPIWLEFICYAVIAGAFTLFFGGNITESVISLFVGAAVRLSLFFSEKIISNKIFDKFFATVIITFLAFLAVKFAWINDVDKVIIGNIMSLIPGIGLTNAIRDLFIGDSIAGLLRSIEAVLTALAIAAGYFLVAVLGGFVL